MSYEDIFEATNIDPAFSAEDRAVILGVIKEAYQGSTIARDMFDNWIASGRDITFYYGEGRFDAWDGVATIDLNELDNAHYIDFYGNAVHDTPLVAIIHELGHALTARTDDYSKDLPAGENQAFVNEIIEQMGGDYVKQLAYMAYDASGDIIKDGYAYSDGIKLDYAWVKKWSWLPNDYDTTEGGTYLEPQKDLLIGSADANELKSGAGDDFVYGLEGDDRLIGGSGDDRLSGGAGADMLDGGDGSDFASYVHAEAGVTISLADVAGNTGDAAGDIFISIENVIGSAHDDVITGDIGANRLEGRDGDDVLTGGGGDDVLVGGAGNDRAVYANGFSSYTIAASGAGLTVTGEGTDTLEGIETLSFGNGTYDVASGTFTPNMSIANSSLTQALASDAFYAVIGSDDLATAGVEGQVTYTVTRLPAGMLLVNGEQASVGTTFTRADIDAGSVVLTAGAVMPGANGPADSFAFTVGDGEGGLVSGTFTADYASFDTARTASKWGGYWGTGGDDYLLGGSGSDKMIGGSGNDLMIGGAGKDLMTGGAGNDRLFAGDGDDVMMGGFGSDLLDGGFGNDMIHGGEGTNWIIGGEGHDTITAGWGDDVIDGGAGNDIIHAGGGDNVVDAGAGNDRLTTGWGDDQIIPGSGDDALYDSGGSNTLWLGGIAGATSDGDDSYSTGHGADLFVLSFEDETGAAAGFGSDTVNGFRLGEGDRLTGSDNVDFAQMLADGEIGGMRSANGGDLVLTFDHPDESSSLTLKGFFWNNDSYLSEDERGAAFGQELGRAQLAGILDEAVNDFGPAAFQATSSTNALVFA
ncbi:calcium-binding protein [Kushneria aurantia]|uniref:Calcium-binding protein n=1 Tax=Kushneria aurantia TaxID=504092 RepID=A0ABV6G7Z0_9GAMM|nr:hypothetical protein [Kushneria aurantia]